MRDVTVCRLFDGKLSIRLDNVELCILPNRLECTPEDMERAFVSVIEEVMDADISAEVEEERKGMLRELSKW